MSIKGRPVIIICGMSIIVVLLNIGLAKVLFYNTSVVQQSINDFAIVFVTGLIGVKMTRKVNLPIWWCDYRDDLKRSIMSVGWIGLFMMTLNALINVSMVNSYQDQILQAEPWIELLTPFTAILLSLRAAFTEEIIYRLFMIATVLWGLKFFISSERDKLIMAVVLSSIAFGLMHGSFLIPFVFGVVLSYTYINYGLIPVLIIHFLSDLIPFMLYSAL